MRLKRLEIDVVFDDDGKITARGKMRIDGPYRMTQDIGESWYQLGPEDHEPDGSVSRDRLGIIIQDLIDPFGWTAIDSQEKGYPS